MIQRLNQKLPRRPESGFTLIELLVVIVILSILSAIVVFAVRGTGDKGKAASFATDAKTLRTAEEAYCSQNGSYGTEAQLAGQFVSQTSTLHRVVVYPTGGNCGGSRYVIKCRVTEPACGAGGAVPDGDFEEPSTDGITGGNWKQVADLPELVDNGQAVRLPDGRAFFIGNGDTGNSTMVVRIYDSVGANWSDVPMFPVDAQPGQIALTWRTVTLLEGSASECGTRCGKVMVYFADRSSPERIRVLFYDPSPSASASPWTEGASIPAVTGVAPTPAINLAMTQVKNCIRGLSNPHCGKVLIIGGVNNFGVGPTVSLKQTLMYDPKDDLWTVGPSTNDDRDSSMATPLSDGRVLVVQGTTVITSEIFDPAGAGGTGSWLFTAGTTPTFAGAPPFNRFGSTSLLADGTVLVIGKRSTTGSQMAARFDPASGGQWTVVGSATGPGGNCNWCGNNFAFRLSSAYGDRVLVLSSPATGGSSAAGPVAKLYDPAAPAASAWSDAAPGLLGNHSSGTGTPKWGATLVGDSRVVIAGGRLVSPLNATTLRTDLFTPPVP